MLKKSFIFIGLIVAALFTCCSRDTIINITGSNTGTVYVLYEGGQNPGSGDYSLIDLSIGTISNDVYKNSNSGQLLNQYPDGVRLSDSALYLTAQGSFGNEGTIYKINARTNVLVSAHNAVINGYSIDISGTKGFVTSGPSGKVLVFDLATLIIIDTISVGVYPQEILAYNDKVYVGNQSVFGGAEDSTVSVIDANTNQVIATVIVGKDPNSIVLLDDGRIMVSSSGANRVSIINGTSLQASVNTPVSFSGGLAVGNSNRVYLSSGPNTVSLIDASNLTVTNFLTADSVVNVYGIGFDKNNNRLYLADAKNFTSNGEVFIYDSNANFVAKYTTGVAPRRIIFK